jgi:hypothetical protein
MNIQMDNIWMLSLKHGQILLLSMTTNIEVISPNH